MGATDQVVERPGRCHAQREEVDKKRQALTHAQEQRMARKVTEQRLKQFLLAMRKLRRCTEGYV